MREFDYPFDEFDATLDEVYELPDLKPRKSMWNVGVIANFFRERYPDPEEQCYKFMRFMGMMDYLTDHLAEFDEGDLAVRGGERALVGQHLMRALHQVFTTRSPAVAMGTSPDEIRQLAAGIRKAALA